jgi:RNA polymerase sigma factor (sigma-70 family)
MTDSPATHPSLLLRLRDPADRQAWSTFVEAYAPLVYGFARKHGLQDADAADLTQDVLQSVSAAVGKLEYDPQRGSFRGWLFTVVRNRLHNILERRRRQCQASGGTSAQLALEAYPAREEDQRALWDEEYEGRLFAWAATQVRGSVQELTWRAFWLTTVEGKSGKEAAGILGMTTAAVYLAKRRIMTRLKEEIEQLQGEAVAAGRDKP